MALSLTEAAAAEVKRVMESEKHPESIYLRIGVVGGGCSGFQYDFRFEEKVDEEKDALYEEHGVKLVCDKKSSLYLDGTTIDFHEGIDKRGFMFNNPNVVKSCGCGSSFQA